MQVTVVYRRLLWLRLKQIQTSIHLILCFRICCTTTSMRLCPAAWCELSLDLQSSGYLSSSAFIWKASSSQSSSLWVNSLTSCCWAKHRQTYKITKLQNCLWDTEVTRSNYRTRTTPTRKKEQPVKINASIGYDATGLIGKFRECRSLKGNCIPLSHTHQCHLVI